VRITITVDSTLDIESAVTALRHFIREKKTVDGTSDVWGIGTNDKKYFSVRVKPNGNYAVKQQE